jgi:hypothetical protein
MSTGFFQRRGGTKTRRFVVIPRAFNVVRTSVESGTNSRADVQRIASLAAAVSPLP